MKVSVIHRVTLEFPDDIDTSDLSVAEYYDKNPLELKTKRLFGALVINHEIIGVNGNETIVTGGE